MRKSPGFAVLALAAFALLGSCGGKRTVKVAFIGSFSGKLVTNSSISMNAIDLYANGPEVAKGRVKYEIVTFDDKSDIATLDGIVADIRARKIPFVIGPLTSAFAIKVLDLMKDDDVLLIGPVAASDKLGGRDDNFIKMYPSIKQASDRLAEYAKGLGIRKITPILDLSNQAFGETWIGSFREILAGGTEVAPAVTFSNPSDVNYARIVEEALRSKADAALLVTNTFDGAMICQMLRKADPGILLLNSSWAFNADFLSSTGRSSEGALFSVAFDGDSSDEGYLRFKAEYKARFQREGSDFTPVYSYESIMVLDRGIAAARSTDPRKVKAAILGAGSYHGLQGDFTIDRFGDARREIRVLAVKDGRFVAVR